MKKGVPLVEIVPKGYFFGTLFSEYSAVVKSSTKFGRRKDVLLGKNSANYLPTFVRIGSKT